MASDGALVRLARGLGRLHFVLALVPLTFLVAALVRAAGSGFTPGPEDYPRVRYQPGPTADVVLATWRRSRLPAEERVVAVWGLADAGAAELDLESDGLMAALRLADAGARLRLSDPRFLAQAEALVGSAAESFEDPYEAVRGATDLLLNSDLAVYAGADLGRLAAAMPDGAVFDCLDAWDRDAVRAQGLAHFAVGGPGWPPWLDPEFQAFVAETRSRTPEDARILVWPERPPTPSPRGRWYLLLAYELAPRALLVPDPELASGTAVQYREWVERLSGRLEELHRDLPRAIESTGATHLLRFVPQADFRASDWRLEELGP
ncbi:MAG: hypothetical protein H8E31_16390 [Planctomycetes bacterium]|nr:hypothetical protein [Planctomycetota bacterium]